MGDLPEPNETAKAASKTDDIGEGDECLEVPSVDCQGGDLATVTGREHRSSSSSIFKESIEDVIQKTDPSFFQWLLSPNGVFFQGALCATLIFVSCYEVLLKKRAVEVGSFWPVPTDAEGKVQIDRFSAASMSFHVAFASVVVSVLTACMRGELHHIFNGQTRSRFLRYIIPGCGFQVTQYLQILALTFMDADVVKVLEQSRLLVLAMMSYAFFGRKQSASGWNALVVITLVALAYSETSQLVKGGSGKKEGEEDEDTGATGYLIGLTLMVLYVLVQCACCLICEKTLKEEKNSPFYVQKFFLEVPGAIFGFFVTTVVNPAVYKGLQDLPALLKKFNILIKPVAPVVLDKVKGKDGEYFDYIWDPLYGWSILVWVTFLFVMMKSWCSGFLTKLLSSLTKQLCSVTTVGILYFMALMHSSKPADTFFTWGGVVKFPMVIVDFAVLSSVMAYTLAGRDESKRDRLKKEKLDLETQLAAKI